MNRTRILIILAPAFALLPMLAAPMPALNSHPAVEIAGYYQTLGLLRDGLTSYTYLTPLESYSALHLHSILSAPFLALGYMEAGRLVSLAAAVIAAYFVYHITYHLAGQRTALLASSLLWINPIYIRLSGRWWPETLGIALTAGALYAALQYIDTEENRWYALSLGFLAISITNHMWEASIALPLAAVFAYRQQYRETAGVAVTAIFTVGCVWWATHLQPSGASTLTHFGLHNNPTILLSFDWWNYIVKIPIHPVPIARTFILPAAILLFGYCGWRSLTEYSLSMVVLTAWLFSGILIPVALPLGADNHVYYLWAVLAPLSIASSIISTDVISRYQPRNLSSLPTISLGLCGAAIIYILIFEAAILGGTSLPIAGSVASPVTDPVDGFENGEVKAAGIELREFNVEKSDEVVFVGEWGQDNAREYHHLPAVSRVLIYSEIHLRNRGPFGDKSPQFTKSLEQVGSCEAMVIRKNQTLSVQPC